MVGNVLIDLMMKGVPEIPRWGEEVLATGRSEQIGGQGANLAQGGGALRSVDPAHGGRRRR